MQTGTNTQATKPKILVTGGAGYIGSHVCVELIAAGFTPVVIDNLHNAKRESLRRVARISGQAPIFYLGDINDKALLAQIFAEHKIGAVMHFAGLKAVGESSQIPANYYRCNVAGTLSLVEAMQEAGVTRMIFSSSATVYGDPASVPIDESFPTSATNPYGRSKLMVEEMLTDIARAPGSAWNFTLLRYFNPVGAHESGLIGEDPQGIPNNLLPYIAQVGIGKLERLSVFGDDYSTPDGTGVRDYIHVVDLARGHVAALNNIVGREPGCRAYNLGTGTGYSVLQMIKAFEQASGTSITYQVVPRRPGDIASCYAEAARARDDLGWQAEFDLPRMMQDTWRWQSQNPEGYPD